MEPLQTSFRWWPSCYILIEKEEAFLAHATAIELVFEHLVRLQLGRVVEYFGIISVRLRLLAHAKFELEFTRCILHFEAFLKRPKTIFRFWRELHEAYILFIRGAATTISRLEASPGCLQGLFMFLQFVLLFAAEVVFISH